MLFGPLLWRRLNLNGTFVSELPLIVSQGSYTLTSGKLEVESHLSWKDDKYLFSEGHEKSLDGYSDQLLSDKINSDESNFYLLWPHSDTNLWQMTHWLKSEYSSSRDQVHINVKLYSVVQ